MRTIKDFPALRVLSYALLAVQPTRSNLSDIQILSSASTQSGPEGSNITFPCTVKHLGTSVITWYKGDQVLSADNFIVRQDTRLGVVVRNGSGIDFVISNLKKSDGGHYSCAVNSKEKVLRVNHLLLINLPPSIQTIHPGGTVTASIGSQVGLQCKATGHPKPSIYWKREHNLAFPWEPREVTKQGDTLVLKNIGREFAGEYICNAENGVGDTLVREAIQLNVLYPPVVKVKQSYYHVRVGGPVTLICIVIANPPPKVKWYKSTMKLLDGERRVSSIIGNTFKLNIDAVSIKDFGEYSCRVSNLLQKDVTQHFFISGCPSSPSILSDIYTVQKYSYELVWTVNSHYPILQQEALLSSPIKFGSGEVFHPESKKIKISGGSPPFSYNFKGLKSNGTFRVRVRSKNKFGWGPFSNNFTFNMFPREKQPMEIQDSKKLFEKNAPLTSDKTSSVEQKSSFFLILFLFFLQISSCLKL